MRQSPYKPAIKSSVLKTALLLVALLVLTIGSFFEYEFSPPPVDPVPDNSALVELVQEQRSNLFAEGQGRVLRLLPDDLEGSRHQRFIVEVQPGLTLLLVHNIDLAERINALTVGDNVAFRGEYVWNEKGGLVHWTHHDPQGRHQGGWIRHNHKIYR